MHALLAIDNSELQRQVVAELGRLEVEADTCSSDCSIVDTYATGNYDLVVSCWWSTGGDLSWCGEIRSKFPHRRSVIVLATDRPVTDELEQVLDSGADDYFSWPVASETLRMRLRVAVLRARDRSQREHVERQLRDSIERFELAVRGANDGLWDAIVEVQPWHRPDTKVWYSTRFKELLGFSSEDEFPHVISSWEERLHPEDHDRVIGALAEHAANRTPYDAEYRLLTKSGEYRWFSARGQATWNDAGEVIRMAGSLRDVTQWKESEAKLQESEEKWRSLVQNAPEIVVLTDPDGTIRFVNRSQPLAQEAIGQSVYDFVDPSYREMIGGAFASLLTTGEPQSYEVQSHAISGGQAWYATRLGPILRNGKIIAVVLIATNITHRKSAEDQLQRERDSLRRLLDLQERERQLVSYDIHDGLVQYLTAGLMHIEAAAGPVEAMSAAESADYHRGVDLLRAALTEGRQLISELRPPILDERGVVEALRYLVSEFQHEIPGLEFIDHAHCGRLAPTLETAIFRVAQEALSNIRKHSEAKRARVALLQHGEWLRLIVHDWGKGFDPSQVRDDRYGLQGIRQRARLLGTRAIIESKPGHGTTIVVDFPIVSAPAADET